MNVKKVEGLIPLNIQLFADNPETPTGAGQDNPTNPGTQQMSSPEVEMQTYDFAGVKVTGADPNLAQAQQSYKEAQTYINTLNAKIKELESAKPQVTKQENVPTPNNNQPLNDANQKIDFVYNKFLETEFNSNRDRVYTQLQTQLGDDFQHIQPMMEKALSNLPIQDKVKIDLVGLSKVALGELAYSRRINTPEQQMQNPQYQQAAVNDPNIQQQVIANKLNNYQNQETLPPNMPNNQGSAPIGGESQIPKDFREAAKLAKQDRINRQSQGIRGSQGIR